MCFPQAPLARRQTTPGLRHCHFDNLSYATTLPSNSQQTYTFDYVTRRGAAWRLELSTLRTHRDPVLTTGTQRKSPASDSVCRAPLRSHIARDRHTGRFSADMAQRGIPERAVCPCLSQLALVKSALLLHAPPCVFELPKFRAPSRQDYANDGRYSVTTPVKTTGSVTDSIRSMHIGLVCCRVSGRYRRVRR